MKVDVYRNPGIWFLSLIAMWLFTTCLGLQTYAFWDTRMFLWQSGADVQGVVMERHTYSGTSIFTVHTIEYDYTFPESNGNTEKFEQEETVGKSLYDSLEVGSPIHIRVDPNRPWQSWIDGNHSELAYPSLCFLGFIFAGGVSTVHFMFHFNFDKAIKRWLRRGPRQNGKA